jgi:hypothetical protein
MSSQLDFLERGEPVEKVSRPVDLFLRVLLTFAAVAVIACAVLIMIKMNETWKSQGGRYLVAVGAFVLLIGVDSQLSRLAWRRFLAGMTPAAGYQQRASRATILLVFAGVFLFSQALWLP